MKTPTQPVTRPPRPGCTVASTWRAANGGQCRLAALVMDRGYGRLPYEFWPGNPVLRFFPLANEVTLAPRP